MASIIPGYEYDIFISYRQKDNKHDGWVTEFVKNLTGELESTFKEEISVYFDVNPHDGLLETHDVDASLKEKLKCLIFIPIISRTYCDPKSFAWEHEFKAFVELASHDQVGMKVKLPNGNVACRVMPVRIHDLDPTDTILFEDILCGVLRGIEFIYEEPGVNRPLTPDDDENKNLKKTRYRNQINKVALAISEIFQGLETEPEWEKFETRIADEEFRQTEELIKKESSFERQALLNNKSKVIGGIIIGLVSIFLVSFLIFSLSKPKEQLEKSIAVLPFINDSPVDSNKYFINGIMEEVLNNLQKIKDFRVLSRTSTDQYKGSDRPIIPEIGKKLGVNYIVEGSGQKYGNAFRLRVQLIRAKGKEAHLWAKSYEQEIKETKDIFSIQNEIAQAIAKELKANITPEEKQLIEETPTTSLTAYDFYQRGKEEIWKFGVAAINREAVGKAETLFKKALKYDSTFARAYTGLALVNWKKSYFEENLSKNLLDTMLLLANIALSHDVNLSEAYWIRGGYYATKGDTEKAIKEYDNANRLNPNDWEAYHGEGWATNDLPYSIENYQKAISLNHGSELPSLLREFTGLLYYAGFPEKGNYYDIEALNLDGDFCGYLNDLISAESSCGSFIKVHELLNRIKKIDSTYDDLDQEFGLFYMYSGQAKESLKYFKKWQKKINAGGIVPYSNSMNEIGYVLLINGYKIESEKYFNKKLDFSINYIKSHRLISQNFYEYYELARIYSIRGDKAKSLENLRIFNQQQKFGSGVASLMKTDPLLSGIRNEPEFQQIVRDVEAKYQAEHERVRKWMEENNFL